MRYARLVLLLLVSPRRALLALIALSIKVEQELALLPTLGWFVAGFVPAFLVSLTYVR